MLAAIEVYNKPQTTYREQVVTVLVVNAWELILKAALRKAKKNIFYKKKRGEDYRSFSLERCLADMEAFHLWPDTVDGDGVRANLHVLTDYRNKTIHLYVSENLGTILYMFLQQSIINYRDFVLAVFGKDLADDITWTLLPLAATTPSELVRSLRVDGDGGSTQVVEEFIGDLRRPDFTLGKSVKKDCLYQLLLTIRQQRQGGFQPVHHNSIDNGFRNVRRFISDKVQRIPLAVRKSVQR